MTLLTRTATCILSAGMLLGAPAARACFGIRVTDFGDDRTTANGTCTLREAIRAANEDVAVDACPAGSTSSRDRICLPAGTYTIDLSTSGQPETSRVGDLDVTGPVEMVGVAADVSKVVGTNGTAQPLLSVADTANDVILRALTFEQTSTSGGVIFNAETNTNPAVMIVDSVIRGGRADQGGGIQNAAGALQIWASRIEGNRATAGGGGILNDSGTLTLTSSQVTDNEAGTDGGGIHTRGSGTLRVFDSRIADNRAPAGNGGGFYVDSDFDVQYSHLSGNSAHAGGGLHLNNGMGEIQRSAFVANSATTNGGAIDALQSTAVRFSTLTQNTAALGGAVYANGTQVLFDSDTIAGNLSGGGVHNQTGAFFENTLMAANAGGNCTGVAPNFGAFNLDDADTCHFANSPGTNQPNLPNTQPLLGALGDNGGPTPTMALLPGGPAIDTVSSVIRTNCQNMLDQRGYGRGRPRTVVGNNDVFHCDIGAYERTAPFVVNTSADGVDANPDDDVCATATGTCTLRAAIQQSVATVGYDEIELGARSHTLSIAGQKENASATGDLDLPAEVLIRGVGPASVIDAARIDRAFDLNDALGGPNGYVMRDLRITRGTAPTGENGGAIRSAGPKLRLERVVLDSNAVGSGASGSAIYVQSPNTFPRRVGRQLELVSSTVTNNTGNMPIYAPDGLIQRSAIHDNAQSDRGSEFIAVRVENSTFSGNFGDSWSAFFAQQAFIDASTLYGNTTAFDPGAVFLLELSAFRNSIIANNLVNGAVVSNCSMNQDGSQSLGHNLTDTAAADCSLTAPTDKVLTQPLLDPLAANGGPTPTHALQPGSPAIDAGDTAACQPLDQRGYFRPADGDGNGSANCDIGAFERFAASDTDGDGVRDSLDKCPFFASPDETDTDGDGRGNVCECTDQTGDGLNTVSDLVAINAAIFSPTLATPLCDGNNDGLCNVNDIVVANIEIFSPTNTSTCARQPVPGP